MILFRNPDSRYRNANGKHIFWSCDQYTDGNYNRDILPWTDTVVGISPRHHEYFTHNYRWPAKKMSVIDLPVRAQDYKPFLSEIKEEGLCLFCSVPERGLLQLRPLWNRILARVPNASLVVTSDYRLWGGDHGTTEYRMAWIGTKKVQYLGMIDRMQLALLQCKSMVQVYPCIYDELFCIATAECQYTGAVPVTSYSGALVSTNRAGILVEGTPGTEQFDAVFVDWVVTMLTDKETYQKQSDLCKQVAQIDFSVDLFTMRWEALLNE